MSGRNILKNIEFKIDRNEYIITLNLSAPKNEVVKACSIYFLDEFLKTERFDLPSTHEIALEIAKKTKNRRFKKILETSCMKDFRSWFDVSDVIHVFRSRLYDFTLDYYRKAYEDCKNFWHYVLDEMKTGESPEDWCRLVVDYTFDYIAVGALNEQKSYEEIPDDDFELTIRLQFEDDREIESYCLDDYNGRMKFCSSIPIVLRVLFFNDFELPEIPDAAEVWDDFLAMLDEEYEIFEPAKEVFQEAIQEMIKEGKEWLFWTIPRKYFLENYEQLVEFLIDNAESVEVVREFAKRLKLDEKETEMLLSTYTLRIW